MKLVKPLSVILSAAALMSFTACSDNNTGYQYMYDQNSGQNYIVVPPATESRQTNAAPLAQEGEIYLNGTDGVDIDLTVMSSTMVYTYVYLMVSTPDDYVGYVVKMDGMFASYYDEDTGNYYVACVVQDATACCAQGIEFELVDRDNYTYPDDYPSEGEYICVQGVFDSYEENGNTYYTLREAEFVDAG